MSKDLLLTYCRYYKGEEECPFEDNEDRLFWQYEQFWYDSQAKKDEHLSELIADYINAGLSDFENRDNTPISLKALLWNRFSHWNYSYPEAFKEWYHTVYYKKAEQ